MSDGPQRGAGPGRKGRGATLNPDGRFESARREAVDDGWGSLDEVLPPLATQVFVDHARSIINRNDSPDIPFRQSINPYRGCEHGCVYCYARPTHGYLGLSAGLDFETRIFHKPDAAALLEAELRRPGYRVEPISLGANTDPYQPLERELGATRGILEVLARFHHPVGIVTKGAALIERDLELLADMARERLVHVYVSITSLDADLKRTLEPRAAGAATRLRAIRMLADAGVPVGVMVAPIIPALTDHELERILERAAEAGARSAGWVMLRLPHEVKDLFRAWLAEHYPLKAEHVMSLINQMREGRDNDPRFGARMRGEGAFAELIARRFRLAARRHGLEGRLPDYDLTRFAPPQRAGDQLGLGL
jgi:DNA repair photolyase